MTDCKDTTYHFVMSVDEFGDHHLFMSTDRLLCDREYEWVRREHPLVACSTVSEAGAPNECECRDGTEVEMHRVEILDGRGDYRMVATADRGRLGYHRTALTAKCREVGRAGPLSYVPSRKASRPQPPPRSMAARMFGRLSTLVASARLRRRHHPH